MRIPWLLNPAVWFVIDQLRITFGTLFLLEPDQAHADVIYLFVMVSVIVFFIIGSVLAKAVSSSSNKVAVAWHDSPLEIESGKMFNALLFLIIIVSVAVGVVYYYAIGYNLFLLGIDSFFTGQEIVDPDTMRLYAYASADAYFAPGYVNQFKNILLPILVSYIGIRAILLGRYRGRVVAALLTPVAVVLLLGTGQRGAFMFAAFCSIVFALSVFRRLNRSYILLASVIVIFLFLMTSLIQGRSTMELRSLSMAIPSRLLEGNQIAGIVGFRYIYDMPISWGADWFGDVKQMIPGLKDSNYVSLASKNHEVLYGSARGTAPLSVPGVLWFNFHILGVTIFPLLLGMIYQTVYQRLIMGRKTLFRLLIFSALTGVLGLWGAGGISILLDLGLVTVLLLYVLGTWVSRWRNFGVASRTNERRTTTGAPNVIGWSRPFKRPLAKWR